MDTDVTDPNNPALPTTTRSTVNWTSIILKAQPDNVPVVDNAPEPAV